MPLVSKLAVHSSQADPWSISRSCRNTNGVKLAPCPGKCLRQLSQVFSSTSVSWSGSAAYAATQSRQRYRSVGISRNIGCKGTARRCAHLLSSGNRTR